MLTPIVHKEVNALLVTHLYHVLCNLCHVFTLKALPFVTGAHITRLVAGSCCEGCLPKVAQQDHTPALNLLLTVSHLRMLANTEQE